MIVIRCSAAGRSWLRFDDLASEQIGHEWLDIILDKAFGGRLSAEDIKEGNQDLAVIKQFLSFIDKHPLVIPSLTMNHSPLDVYSAAMKKYWELAQSEVVLLDFDDGLFNRCLMQGLISITGSTESKNKE